MSHQDLVWQAKMLSTVERGRPKLSNLRRSVSSLYYALFHFLIYHSTSLFMGTNAARSAFRNVLARGYDHRKMREACEAFQKPRIQKDRFKDLEPTGYSVPVEIQDLAGLFVELQELRHLADYNFNRKWTRTEVQSWINLAENTIKSFEQIPLKDPHRSFFLGNLIAWSKH